MPWDEKDEGVGGSIEYDFSILESKVGFTEYNEGNTCLAILEGEKEFSNGKVMDDNLWIGAPKGAADGSWSWTANKEGTAFVPTDGDEDRRFPKQSKIQQFINSAVKAGVPIRDRTDNSLDFSGWAGLKVRIREEEKSGKFDGEERSWRQPLVIAYLGEVATAGATPKPVNAESNGGSDDLMDRAKAIAAECDDMVEYMDKVSRELGIPLDHPLCSEKFFDSVKA